MLPERPFTPETLAERWQCSAQTVRDLINGGRLPAFRLGRMFRISQQVVQDFEAAGDPPATVEPQSPRRMSRWPEEQIMIRHARPRKSHSASKVPES